MYNKRVYGLAAPRIINASQNIIIIEHDEVCFIDKTPYYLNNAIFNN